MAVTDAKDKKMSKSILLRAPVLTLSGYGVHARQVARWLFEKEEELGLDITVEPLNWGNTGWLTDVEAEDGLVGRVLQAAQNVKPFYDVTIQLQLPNEWNPMLGRFNIGMTAGVEADRCSTAWVEAVNRMNLVIVPSEFTKQVFMNSGPVNTEIHVIPESYIDECTSGTGSIDLDVPTDFNFLVFGQVTGNNPDNDRKNLAYTVKWLSECLKDRPSVGVIIKTNVMRNTKIDKMATTNLMAKLVAEVKQGPGPKFHLLHGSMTNTEVVGLYNHPKVKALLTLTHGEGFGLPILEAATCGLPVIAPGWSGHMDFMSHGRFSKVIHRLAPVHESRVDNEIFVAGAQWAYPDELDAKKRILKFVDSSETPREWAKELKEKLIPLYSFERISKYYDDKLLDHVRESNE